LKPERAAAARLDETALLERAQRGEGAALEALLSSIQKDVYNLALRFLWSPEDAEDAAQEILLKVAANLAGFERRSSLRTWVLKIASNYLIDAKRSRAERAELSFDQIERSLKLGGQTAGFEEESDGALVLDQVRMACTHAMLLCLNRERRIAFILGEVFNLPGPVAARILEITPDTYRQRLARAREAMSAFLCGRCGLANPANPCRCTLRVGYARRQSAWRPYLEYAERLQESGQVAAIPAQDLQRLGEIERIAAIYRGNPRHELSGGAMRRIKAALLQTPSP
jgi:RNA polymerase sigma factor (sigma-70 family)